MEIILTYDGLKPQEIPVPPREPDIVPPAEPNPGTKPYRDPEIHPEHEPLTEPPPAPWEIPARPAGGIKKGNKIKNQRGNPVYIYVQGDAYFYFHNTSSNDHCRRWT